MGRDRHVRLGRVGAKPRGPAQRRLRPERRVPDATNRGEDRDRLTHSGVRGHDRERQREPLTRDLPVVFRPPGRRGSEHSDGNRVAVQHVPLLTAKDRERDGNAVLHGRRRDQQPPRLKREQDLVECVQIHPPSLHQPRRDRFLRALLSVGPDPLRRREREPRLAAEPQPHIAWKPGGDQHVELLPDQNAVGRHVHGERDLIAALGRRCAVEQGPRGSFERGRGTRRLVRRDGDGRGRHDRPPLLHPHRSDHQRARTLGAERQLPHGRPERASHSRSPARIAAERDVGDFVRGNDREARKRRQREVERLGRPSARTDGEHQRVPDREPRAVHARDHDRRTRLQLGDQPDDRDHQSFTPDSPAARACPVRARRVRSSS